MAFFSVVIPLYNKEAFIEETIKSVLHQTFQDFEVIVIDDGSTDGGFKIASQFQSEKIKLFQQHNQGVSVARNIGIEQATSNYIALLDADDLWYDNHLSELKKQIDLFPNAGLYCNNYEVFYCENFSKNARFNLEFNKDCLIVEDYFKASTINAIALTSAVAFSKEKFKILEGFMPHLKTTQDSDLWIRFALNYQVSFNPVISVSYRTYLDNSLSKNVHNTMCHSFINTYSEEEKNKPSLKLYLDLNRYAFAIRSKLYGPKWVYKILKKDIKTSNLNKKQRVLLNSPLFLLKFMKWLHTFLIKKGVYLTSFK